MKKLYVLYAAVFLFLAQFAGAQELGDVEVVTKKLQDVRISKYGYVLQYPTSDLYRGELYIPREWFLNTADRTIIADQKISYLNIDVPLLKVTYIDGALKYVTILIPKQYSQTITPVYDGIPVEPQGFRGGPALSDADLKAKFDEQLSKATLDLR